MEIPTVQSKNKRTIIRTTSHNGLPVFFSTQYLLRKDKANVLNFSKPAGIQINQWRFSTVQSKKGKAKESS